MKTNVMLLGLLLSGCSSALKPVCQFKEKRFIEGASVVLQAQEQLCICGEKRWTCISMPGLGVSDPSGGDSQARDGSNNNVSQPGNQMNLGQGTQNPPRGKGNSERFDDEGF